VFDAFIVRFALHAGDGDVALRDFHDFPFSAHGFELLDATFEIALDAGTLEGEVLQNFRVGLVDETFDDEVTVFWGFDIFEVFPV
jgi:hypothetical protein